MSKKKIYKYHTSLSFKGKDGKQHSLATQLYKISVYIIFDSDSSQQGGIDPAQLVKMQKAIKKDFEIGEITDLILGTEISVTTDKDGFYVKVEDEK